jgi:hypothetical protein
MLQAAEFFIKVTRFDFACFAAKKRSKTQPDHQTTRHQATRPPETKRASRNNIFARSNTFREPPV